MKTSTIRGKKVKAWAVLYRRPVIFGATYMLAGVYCGSKPTRNQIAKDEVLVPCVISYDLPKYTLPKKK